MQAINDHMMLPHNNIHRALQLVKLLAQPPWLVLWVSSPVLF
jgi:hypothetical protein